LRSSSTAPLVGPLSCSAFGISFSTFFCPNASSGKEVYTLPPFTSLAKCSNERS
jgi:hypothetical protein